MRLGERKTHCVNGHEFTEQNTVTTYRPRRGRVVRRCRACKCEIDKIYNVYKRRSK